MIRRLDITTTGLDIGQALTPQLNAGCALKVTARVFSEDMGQITPSSIRYRVDDVLSGQAMTSWTTLTPANPTTFVINATTNAIRNPGHDFERRQIMVEASDADGPFRSTFDYLLFNTLGTG